jgi:hypothetical protein
MACTTHLNGAGHRLASQARHESEALKETFASRNVVLEFTALQQWQVRLLLYSSKNGSVPHMPTFCLPPPPALSTNNSDNAVFLIELGKRICILFLYHLDFSRRSRVRG